MPGVCWTWLAAGDDPLISCLVFLLVQKENFNEGSVLWKSGFKCCKPGFKSVSQVLSVVRQDLSVSYFRGDSIYFWMCVFESSQTRCRLLNSDGTWIKLLCTIMWLYLYPKERKLWTYLPILLIPLLSFNFWIQFFYLCCLCSLLLLPVLLLCCRQFWKKM